ncbi:MAG: sugar phosphate isomerase/epimerase, partial [Oscillospiraceae bacterium]|nr:sugar phosphate isomerase/epimerase [Oscillospiraceae bacterium]
MNMRLGACVGADRAAFAKNSGCDYIEMNFASVARMTDDAFLSVQRQLCNADIRAEAMNCFIPADQFPLCRLTAEDLPALCDFIETGMRRARQIGTKIAVFGSGGARRLPEGFTKQDGWHMLAPYFRTAGEIGWKYGIQIAIEPLCASECNAVNTVDDALAFGAVIAHANVGVLADLYHVCKNGE